MFGVCIIWTTFVEYLLLSFIDCSNFSFYCALMIGDLYYFCWIIILELSLILIPLSPPLDDIRVMVIVWRLKGNIIGTALCWIV